MIIKIVKTSLNGYLFSLGYDFEKVVERISILFHVEKDYITGRGRQKDWVPGQGFTLLLDCG